VQTLCKLRACWLGLSEPADSENWVWADGAAGGTKGKWVGYVNWEKGEPNNHGGRDEDATFMNFWGDLGMPPPDLKAMMEAFKKMSDPGEFHAHLKPLVGHWAWVVRHRDSPDQPWMESKGTSERKWTLDGRFLLEEVKGEMMEVAPFQGLGISTYDKVKKKYVSVWADSFGAGFVISEGTCDPSGKVITYRNERPDLMSGQTKRYKSVLRIINNNKHVFEGYDTTPDGKEFMSFEATSTRK
jgi:hypothetical protein